MSGDAAWDSVFNMFCTNTVVAYTSLTCAWLLFQYFSWPRDTGKTTVPRFDDSLLKCNHG